jgi:hypothetical protein
MRRAFPLLLAAAVGAGWTSLFAAALRAPVDDADVWWVAAAGRQMLATGRVPVVNGFSFVEPDHPWVMHEWLFGPAYAWGLQKLGPEVFALVAGAAFVALGLAVALATVGRARHLAVGCAAAGVAAVLFAHPTARPTWVALVFPAVMALLAFRERLGRAAAVACVGVALVWTNAHGSFPLAVALLAAAAWAEPADRTRRIGTAVAAAAATFVNPYGVRLHALVVEYVAGGMGVPGGELAPIVEYAPVWRPAYFALDSVPATLALAALVLAAARGVTRREHRARSALVLVLAPLAVLHARNAPVVAVVAAVVLVPVLDDLVDRSPLASFAGEAWRPGRRSALAAAALLAVTAAVALATLGPRTADAWISPDLGGPAFLHLARALPDGARVVTPFRSAGLVLWLDGERGVRVFYDSRNDCYSGDMRRTGLTLLERPPDEIRETIESRGAGYALVPSPRSATDAMRRAVDGALAAAPGWRVEAREGEWALYQRNP